MSIKHINSMRQAVMNYYAASVDGQAKMKRNSEIYLAEFAEPENAKIKAELDRARWEAEEAIRTAQEDGRAEALAWGELHGADIPDDAKLLQFDMSPEQFADLVARHKNNGTMASLLKQYGDRMNDKQKEKNDFGKMPEKYYNTSGIPTAEDKAGVYDRFAMSARDLMSRIDSPAGTFGGGTDSTLLKSSIESFGTPNAFNQPLFDLL